MVDVCGNSVELIGTYGGDLEHALSAWTSTSRELTNEKRARIPALLKTLAENGHHTPFEKSALHFLVTSDIASHIHIIKHRIGVSVNAESARYRELREDRIYVPGDWPEDCQRDLRDLATFCCGFYHGILGRLVERGIDRKRAKESARFALPYASQITSDVQFNFRSFMHFIGLRADSHAQREIRGIAASMLHFVHRTGAFTHSLWAFGWDGNRIHALCEELGVHRAPLDDPPDEGGDPLDMPIDHAPEE